MTKVKREYIPYEMTKVVEAELEKMRKESKSYREPTRIEAWRRVHQKMVKQLFKSTGGFKI